MTNHDKAVAIVDHIKKHEYGGNAEKFASEFGSDDDAIQEIYFWLEDGACEDENEINMCVGRYFLCQ